jgi:membrane protease YdiL (CAAX protease family)
MWTPGDSILHPSPEAAARAWSVPAALGAGLAAGLVALAISEALTRWTALGKALSDLLAESLGPLDRANAWLLALASGLAEEMFFRGALQPKVGIVGASILFGAAHFLPRRELALWSVYAIGIGLGLGALYEWTGSRPTSSSTASTCRGSPAARSGRAQSQSAMASISTRAPSGSEATPTVTRAGAGSALKNSP